MIPPAPAPPYPGHGPPVLPRWSPWQVPAFPILGLVTALGAVASVGLVVLLAVSTPRAALLTVPLTVVVGAVWLFGLLRLLDPVERRPAWLGAAALVWGGSVAVAVGAGGGFGWLAPAARTRWEETLTARAALAGQSAVAAEPLPAGLRTTVLAVAVMVCAVAGLLLWPLIVVALAGAAALARTPHAGKPAVSAVAVAAFAGKSGLATLLIGMVERW